MQQSTRQQSTHTSLSSLRALLSAALLTASFASAPVWAEPAKSAESIKPTTTMQPTSQAALNINTADAQTLAEKLNGIGQTKAEAIVAYRDQHGAFKSVDELVNVTGIGAATLEKNRSVISVN
jgi:competence protein ComEA